MSALAVYFERLGIATVVVGLVKPHLEKIKPPRALWVPFELGRPLGGYVDGGDFQKKVLKRALSLLDRSDGPVILESFDADDPGLADKPDWQAPTLDSCSSVVEEVRALKPAWEAAMATRGRTLVGLSGLEIEQAADYLERFDTDDPAENPDDSMSDLLRMRFCADDVRTYFAEAAMGSVVPSSAQIGDWFWGSTLAAQVIQRIRHQNKDDDHKVRALVCGKLLVPGARVA